MSRTPFGNRRARPALESSGNGAMRKEGKSLIKNQMSTQFRFNDIERFIKDVQCDRERHVPSETLIHPRHFSPKLPPFLFLSSLFRHHAMPQFWTSWGLKIHVLQRQTIRLMRRRLHAH
jgi:hypothetical protein